MLGTPLLLGDDGYQISRSVRLRSSASAYLNRTPGSAGNRKTMTLSMWQKRGAFNGTSEPAIMWAGTNSSNYTLFRWGDGVGNSDSKFKLNLNMYTGSTNINLVTTPLYRDPSAWYHIVLSIDTTQATAANRVRLYINGTEVTSFSSASYPSQNLDLLFNSTNSHEIGRFNFGSYLDGYMTEVNFVDGQQLTPNSFGETDAITGVWKSKKYSGTYGTNGFYLNFSDPSAASASVLGKDYSGNNNNWTPNNISVTAGTTYDSMIDVPTMWADGNSGRGNYAIVNPLSKGTSQTNIIDGNLYAVPTSGGSNWGTVFSSMAIPTSGKWYAEATAVVYTGSGNNSSLGVVDGASFIPTNTAILYQYTTGEGFDGILAHLFSDYVAPISDGVQGTNVTGQTASSINLMLALDVDNGKVYAGYNGTWLNSGNPAGNTGEVATRTFSANDVIAGHTSWNGTNDQAQHFNFGQRPFAYTPPTGFKALNTQNLPVPTIKKGSSYFDISTWTGDQSARTITNSGMQPDFLWTKSRSNAEDHRLSDAVRGGNGTVLGTLASNTTGVEAFDTDVTGFTSNGFNIRAGTNSPNVTGRTYVGWQWKEGATAGFDIVTYTGTGANRTVAHNLGVAPSMVIVKRRDSGPSSWTVWHNSFSSIEYIYLNLTNAKSSSSGSTVWNSTLPTSSVFSLGTYSDVNANGGTYVAYLFSEVAGFSKFGSYTGNGSADGAFVFCGFRPRWIMIKRTDTTASWCVVDTSRSPNNTSVNGGMQNVLFPNVSNAEDTGADMCDGVSNGFKFRQNAASFNASGGTYIFAAFAENPFKYSLAR